MNVKVQCTCGARFAFDVEPVNGRMPVRVNCPACGADGTDLANQVIQEQWAGTQPSPIAPDLPSTPSPGHAPRLRIHRTHAPEAAAPAAETPAATSCAKHPNEPAVETCRVCGKPMCTRCMELFGYVCSVYCRDQAERQKIKVPVYKHQRSVVEQRANARAKQFLVACALVFAAALGAFLWYVLSGSRPHVIYSQRLSGGDAAAFYELLAPHNLLSVRRSEIALLDVAGQKQLWSTRLESAAAGSSNAGSPPDVVLAAGDAWLLVGNRIEQFDLKNGNQKQTITLESPVLSLTHNASEILAVSGNDKGPLTLVRVALPDGTVQTNVIESETPKQPASRGTTAVTSARTVVAANGARSPADGADLDYNGNRYLADGNGAMRVSIRLLEYKVITHEAMKPKEKTYLNEDLSAAQSLDASQEVMNDMRRQQTGGTAKEDVSRFRVVLKPLLNKDAPEWTGEVIGPPAFYPLKTVDVLAGGSSFSVFDKNCKKLWEAKTTYSLPNVPPGETSDAGSVLNPPCIENGNTLYVFDQGMLTAFDPMTGDVRWRLTSVGISNVKFDSAGKIYVATTTASPDTLQFSQQINLLNKTEPLILKVDPSSGKVLWRVKNIADNCFPSGKFVYVSRTSTDPLSALNPSQEPNHFYNLYRLNPSNGDVMWGYFQPKWPERFDAQANWILLRFGDELQVLKFFSL